VEDWGNILIFSAVHDYGLCPLNWTETMMAHVIRHNLGCLAGLWSPKLHLCVLEIVVVDSFRTYIGL
jgi:hypothetical protein